MDIYSIYWWCLPFHFHFYLLGLAVYGPNSPQVGSIVDLLFIWLLFLTPLPACQGIYQGKNQPSPWGISEFGRAQDVVGSVDVFRITFRLSASSFTINRRLFSAQEFWSVCAHHICFVLIFAAFETSYAPLFSPVRQFFLFCWGCQPFKTFAKLAPVVLVVLKLPGFCAMSLWKRSCTYDQFLTNGFCASIPFQHPVPFTHQVNEFSDVWLPWRPNQEFTQHGSCSSSRPLINQMRHQTGRRNALPLKRFLLYLYVLLNNRFLHLKPGVRGCSTENLHAISLVPFTCFWNRLAQNTCLWRLMRFRRQLSRSVSASLNSLVIFMYVCTGRTYRAESISVSGRLISDFLSGGVLGYANFRCSRTWRPSAFSLRDHRWWSQQASCLRMRRRRLIN